MMIDYNEPSGHLLVSFSLAGLGGLVGCTSDWRSGVSGWTPTGSATFFRGD